MTDSFEEFTLFLIFVNCSIFSVATPVFSESSFAALLRASAAIEFNSAVSVFTTGAVSWFARASRLFSESDIVLSSFMTIEKSTVRRLMFDNALLYSSEIFSTSNCIPVISEMFISRTPFKDTFPFVSAVIFAFIVDFEVNANTCASAFTGMPLPV